MRFCLLLLAAALSFSTGCKIVYNVERQVPAEIFLGAEVRVVGVSPFDANEEHNKLLVSEKVSARLAGSEIFNVVERTKIDAAIKEIEETSTDYFDQNTAVEFGRLVAADALIFGRCTTYANDEALPVTLVKREPYTVQETVNGQVKNVTKYREVQVQAMTMQRSLSVDLNFKAVNVETGQVVGGDTFSRNANPAWITSDPRPDLKTIRRPDNVVDKVIDGRLWSDRAIDELSARIAAKLIPQTVREAIEWQRVPRYAEAAERYFKFGDFANAARELEQDNRAADSDARVNPDQKAQLRYLLGVTYACMQRYDEGLALLQQAADSLPSDVHISMISRVKRWKADAEALARQINNGS